MLDVSPSVCLALLPPISNPARAGSFAADCLVRWVSWMVKYVSAAFLVLFQNVSVTPLFPEMLVGRKQCCDFCARPQGHKMLFIPRSVEIPRGKAHL